MADAPEQYEHEHIEEELEDLRKELEHFQKEKERVRAIVGKIGGAPKTQIKIINAVFGSQKRIEQKLLESLMEQLT